MSFCHECGEALVQGWAYCQGCGAKLPEPVMEAASAGPTRRQPLTAEPVTPDTEPDSTPDIEPPAMADGVLAPADASSTPEGPIAPADIETLLGFEWTNTLAMPEDDVVLDATPAAIDSIDAAADPAEAPTKEAAPERNRRRVALVATGVVAILALLAVTTLHIVGTHDRLNRTRDTLAATESDLSDTRDELDVTSEKLTSTEDELSTRTTERNKARADLADAEAELGATTSALNDARGKVDLQASQIEDLRTCLVGVMDALLYVADGFYMAAVDALDAVQFECDRAAKSVV